MTKTNLTVDREQIAQTLLDQAIATQERVEALATSSATPSRSLGWPSLLLGLGLGAGLTAVAMIFVGGLV